MEGGAVGHNIERYPPKDHPCQVWFNSVQGFQRRRFKCESLRRTTDGRTGTDGRGPTDDGRQVMAKAHMAFGQVSIKGINTESQFKFTDNINGCTEKRNSY
jgi:hypothetical protein